MIRRMLNSSTIKIPYMSNNVNYSTNNTVDILQPPIGIGAKNIFSPTKKGDKVRPVNPPLGKQKPLKQGFLGLTSKSTFWRMAQKKVLELLAIRLSCTAGRQFGILNHKRTIPLMLENTRRKRPRL